MKVSEPVFSISSSWQPTMPLPHMLRIWKMLTNIIDLRIRAMTVYSFGGGMGVQRMCATGKHPRIISNGRPRGEDLDVANRSQLVATDVEGLRPICNSNTRCRRGVHGVAYLSAQHHRHWRCRMSPAMVGVRFACAA